MSLVYVFPGQGSQKLGMGDQLFGRFPDLVGAADAQLGYSVQELCLRDSAGRLGRTQFTQPALYVVNALSYLARIQDGQRRPDFVAGHSLGEYNALFAADVFDFVTGLRLVQKRGEMMATVQGGGMAAVVGISSDRVSEILYNFAFDTVDVANFNSPKQTVISGPAQDVTAVSVLFKEAGAKVVALNVSGAFHSRMMEPVQAQFREFLDGFEFQSPRVPVIANVSALPYVPAKAKDILAQQIARSVRWTESIQHLLHQGAPEFVEVGPGTVLTGLIRQIMKEFAPAESAGRAV